MTNKNPEHLILIGGNFIADLEKIKFIARILATKPGGTVKLRRTNMRENGDCTFELHIWGFTAPEWDEVVQWLGLEHIDLRHYSPGLLI